MNAFYCVMEANSLLFSVNVPVGAMKNNFGKAIWANLRSIELVYNCYISIVPVLSSNFFHSSFRMPFYTTINPLPMPDALDQRKFWWIWRKLNMGTNVSPFLCTYFAINPFSPNFSLPVFLCLFLLLNLLIYTSLLSLFSFFLMLLRKGYFINETSSDL